MSSIRNPRKLYVSNVSRDARERDVGRLFSEVGRIDRIQFKQNYCFVEYDDSRSAEDAIRKFNGIDFMGRRLVVEMYVYRGGDPRYRPSAQGDRDRFGGRGSFGGGFGGRGGGGGHHLAGKGYRLIVEGLDQMTSWQDLKDFGRTAGQSVSFADVYNGRRGSKEGVIEYHDYDDFKHAARYLDEARLNGVRVHVFEDKKRNEQRMDRDHHRRRRSSRSPRGGDRSRSRSRSRDRGRRRMRSPRSRSHSRGKESGDEKGLKRRASRSASADRPRRRSVSSGKMSPPPMAKKEMKSDDGSR